MVHGQVKHLLAVQVSFLQKLVHIDTCQPGSRNICVNYVTFTAPTQEPQQPQREVTESDRNRNIGIGVGVGVGGFLLIVVIVIIIAVVVLAIKKKRSSEKYVLNYSTVYGKHNTVVKSLKLP